MINVLLIDTSFIEALFAYIWLLLTFPLILVLPSMVVVTSPRPILIGTFAVAVPIVIPLVVFELSILSVDVESNEILVPSTTKVPSISVLSKFVFPLTSILPSISTVASALVTYTFLPIYVSLVILVSFVIFISVNLPWPNDAVLLELIHPDIEMFPADMLMKWLVNVSVGSGTCPTIKVLLIDTSFIDALLTNIWLPLKFPKTVKSSFIVVFPPTVPILEVWYKSPLESTTTIFVLSGAVGNVSNLTIGWEVLYPTELDTCSLLCGLCVPIPIPPSWVMVIRWVSVSLPPVFLVSSLPVKNLICWPASPLACIFILPWGLPPVDKCKTSWRSLIPSESLSPPSPISFPLVFPSQVSGL